MRVWAIVCSLAVGCAFRLPGTAPDTPEVRFTSVTSSLAELAPGRYGFTVTAVLRNDLDEPISNVAASLTFGGREAQFRWRDPDARDGASATPQPTDIPAHSDATYTFVVDALASAAPPGPVLVNGVATFDGTRSATPLDPPLALPFATLDPPIVITKATDAALRQAIQMARGAPGPDRITFAPGITRIALDSAAGELPTLDGTGGDLVIDGAGAVTLALDPSWEQQEGRYGLRITGGTVIVAGLTFEDFGFNYRNEGSLDPNNCGPSSAQLEGGAIRIDNGTLVLDGNTFRDLDVAERNCFAASIRLEGGSDHRIIGNTWVDQSMDALFVDAATLEISDNVMLPDPVLSKDDECIFVNTQGGHDLWITGNVCVDMEFSAVIARGTDAGTLYVVNNTFVREGHVGLSAVRREQGARPVVLRNNAYLANAPTALAPDLTGTGFDIAFETVSGSPLCTSCTSATIDAASVADVADPMVANQAGVRPDDFTPRAGSPLVDSGTDLLDRNGTAPGRFTGAGPDRGAIEAR